MQGSLLANDSRTNARAVADVAQSVGITRSVKHWMDIVSEATEQSTYTTKGDNDE